MLAGRGRWDSSSLACSATKKERRLTMYVMTCKGVQLYRLDQEKTDERGRGKDWMRRWKVLSHCSTVSYRMGGLRPGNKKEGPVIGERGERELGQVAGEAEAE